MGSIPSTAAVTCRPALAQDRADVFEFCKDIWDGGDYVPEVWDEWFNDPSGVLAVAELDGRAIGCAKVTRMDDGQWWLEGFRVDPKLQGLKVGTHIHTYVTDWWLEHGNGILRLMTDARNFAVHRLCEKTGYAKTHEVCGYKTFPIAEPIDSFSPVQDLQEAAAFSTASESIQTAHGLMDFGWRVGTPSPSIFENHAREGVDYHHFFHWWKGKRGVFSFWINEDREQRTIMHIGVAACAIQDMHALLMDARRLAAQQKLDDVFQIAFDIPDVISQLGSVGFEKHWKNNAFVFEKRHPRTT